jgi:hypothetical protein
MDNLTAIVDVLRQTLQMSIEVKTVSCGIFENLWNNPNRAVRYASISNDALHYVQHILLNWVGCG